MLLWHLLLREIQHWCHLPRELQTAYHYLPRETVITWMLRILNGIFNSPSTLFMDLHLLHGQQLGETKHSDSLWYRLGLLRLQQRNYWSHLQQSLEIHPWHTSSTNKSLTTANETGLCLLEGTVRNDDDGVKHIFVLETVFIIQTYQLICYQHGDLLKNSLMNTETQMSKHKLNLGTQHMYWHGHLGNSKRLFQRPYQVCCS